MVNIFAEELGFNRTLGLFGWVSLLLAFLVFKRLPLLALCSLTPICFLLFPPAVIVLGQVLPHPSQIYRLLYAFPLCIVFVAGIVLLLGRLKVSRLGSSVSLLVGILLTVYPYAPVHGRLAFSVFAPPAPLELEDIDRTADTLSKLPLKCLTKHPQWIVTDVVSFHALAAFLGWQPYRFPDRRSLESLSLTTEKLKKRINSQHYRPTCAVLLYEGQEETHPESKVAQASGHWYQQHANRSRRVSAEDRALVEKMYANWTKRSIPGSYLLYLPPEKK